MSATVRAAPPNSLVLIADSNEIEIPEAMGGSLIAATASCIAVGCQSDVDGEIEFTLGSSQQVDPGYQPAFRGLVDTPNRKLAILSVVRETILETAVMDLSTPVRIWVNDLKEPDIVIVGIE